MRQKKKNRRERERERREKKKKKELLAKTRRFCLGRMQPPNENARSEFPTLNYDLVVEAHKATFTSVSRTARGRDKVIDAKHSRVNARAFVLPLMLLVWQIMVEPPFERNELNNISLHVKFYLLKITVVTLSDPYYLPNISGNIEWLKNIARERWTFSLPATTFVPVDADILLYIYILITIERTNENILQ